MEFKRKAWLFNGSNWIEVEFPLATEMVEWEESLKAAGYRPFRSIEMRNGGYCINVHESVKEHGRFLVLMTTQGSMFPVIAEGFPALLTVLNQMVPIVKIAGDTEARHPRSDLPY